MIAKIFLALVGLMYIGLAAWCSLAPHTTSGKVGFQLKPGSGQSEFLVIYGGLELAMALIFLWPLFNRDVLFYSLTTCLIIHGCLVFFRTLSFFLFRGMGSTTVYLAIGEWAILILTAVLWFWHSRQS